MNKEHQKFINSYNASHFLNEQEETGLIDVLKELIVSIKNTRLKGGFVINLIPIEDDNKKVIGIRREYTISLLQEVKE